MKRNMGVNDRIIRTVLAVVIAVLYFTKVLSGTIGLVLLVLAGIFAISSFFSVCPMYSLLGISSKKKQTNS